MGLSRATYYRPVANWAQRDGPVIEALTALSTTNPPTSQWIEAWPTSSTTPRSFAARTAARMRPSAPNTCSVLPLRTCLATSPPARPRRRAGRGAGGRGSCRAGAGRRPGGLRIPSPRRREGPGRAQAGTSPSRSLHRDVPRDRPARRSTPGGRPGRRTKARRDGWFQPRHVRRRPPHTYSKSTTLLASALVSGSAPMSS